MGASYDKIKDEGEGIGSSRKSSKREYKYWLEHIRYSRNTRLRIRLGYWSAWFVSVWSFFILVFLFCNLFCVDKPMSDGVLITLLTTTTAQVIGIALIAMKDLF